MEEYLIHWWNGELAQYEFLCLEIAQLNKIFKLAQYITGLITIFELIRFTKVMGGFRIVSYTSILFFRFMNLVFNIPNLFFRLTIGIMLTLLGEKNFKDTFKSVFIDHVQESADKADKQAVSHPLVRCFNWLEKHPVSERTIKIVTFSSLVIFSLGELFTS